MAKDNFSYDELINILGNQAHILQEKLAKLPDTSPKILDKLSKINNNYILEKVARNPSTLSKTLDILSQSKYDNVRYGVLQNPNASSKHIDEIFKTTIVYISRVEYYEIKLRWQKDIFTAIVNHNNTSSETRAQATSYLEKAQEKLEELKSQWSNM